MTNYPECLQRAKWLGELPEGYSWRVYRLRWWMFGVELASESGQYYLHVRVHRWASKRYWQAVGRDMVANFDQFKKLSITADELAKMYDLVSYLETKPLDMEVLVDNRQVNPPVKS